MIERIDHIRDMIMLQQSHSTVRTLWESLDLATVMEDALRLENGVNITHESVQIERQYADMPPVYLAKGLLLQILVNLTSNACQAMAEMPPQKRRLTLRIVPHGQDRVRLVVEDNGCGIQPHNLTTIFTQGFTTKTDGHGFGLHHACLLAEDMEGTLRAESEGLGKGARFILDLPARKAPNSEPAPAPAPAATLSDTHSSEGNTTLP
jgi:C4-dicarboxylate-specific signal transduction histidine kinase